MTDAEQEALSIYETICATGADRPFAFKSIDEMQRKTSDWMANNPALVALRGAAPDVATAFLKNSYEWLDAEARATEHRDSQTPHTWVSKYSICHTLGDAIQFALEKASRPLPPDIVLKVLQEFSGRFSMARMYFPFVQFLSALTREELTKDIREVLRKLHVQFAPSPSGKIDAATAKTRDRIGELMRVEGERQLDPGRGPWSQIVFDEVTAKDEIGRTGWEALLEHCRALESTAPGAKWKKRAEETICALGRDEAMTGMLSWLALGPTPGQLREARSPIEDSAYQKGVIWCVALSNESEAATAVADFAIAAYEKSP